MAKTGGWFKKLRDKQRKQATETKLGKQRAVITRHASPHHDKRISFEAHRRLIVEHAINLGCRVTDTNKDGSQQDVTFHGDGLVDDSLGTLKAPKTTAERAKADKRPSIKSEVKEGWKPRGFAQRKYGRQSGCYLAR